MADISMKDFLLQYFMQMRFNDMPVAVKAQYDEYAKRDNFRSDSNMKMWKEKLESGVMPDPKDGEYKLEDGEWEKLYIEFRNAFFEMENNRDNLDKKKTLPVLEKYMGPNKLFSITPATSTEEVEIGKLNKLLTDNDLEKVLKEQGIITEDFKYKDLLDGIAKQKYNTDFKFQEVLKRTARYLTAATDPSSYYYDEKLAVDVLNNVPADFKTLSTAFETTKVDPLKLQTFKGIGNNHGEFEILLRELTGNSKFRNDFPSTKIKEQFDKAKEKVAYDDPDSKDYVPPKPLEKVSAWKKIAALPGKTYADVLKKYITLRGDEMFFSLEAKDIVNAIHKEKIKPQDGMEAVLNKAKDITNGLKYKSPKASEHFEWFVKQMEELKVTKPEAYKKAMHDGRQMRILVEQMTISAIKEGKTEALQTAMETMTVIRYGLTTSKIMDAIGKENVSILSDPNLSWNKNEAVQLVTNAMDKTIEYGFRTLGYGITIVGNAYKLRRSKFKGKSKEFDEERKRMKAQDDMDKQLKEDNLTNLTDERSQIEAERDAEDLRMAGEVQTKEGEVNTLETTVNSFNQGSNAINEGNLAQRKQELENARIREEKQRAKRDTAQANLDTAQQTSDNYDNLMKEINDLKTEISDINTDIAKDEEQIDKLKKELENIDPNNYKTAKEQYDTQQKQQELAKLEDELKNKQQKLTEKKQARRNKQDERRKASAAAYRAKKSLPRLHLALATEESNLSITKGENDSKEARLNSFEVSLNDYKLQSDELTALKDEKANKYNAATARLTELDTHMTEINDELNNWDANHEEKHIKDFEKMMAYWDMLQTGRLSHRGKMYNYGRYGFNAKTAQKNFSGKAPNLIAEYANNYHYNAA